MDILQTISAELKVPLPQIKASVELLDGGNTVPFISRYRKEVTGGLDDTVLRNLEERLNYLRALTKRKAEVESLIGAVGGLTPEVSAALAAAAVLSEVEDIYKPFRPKRKTRASVARERGLRPLAEYAIAMQGDANADLTAKAAEFVTVNADNSDATDTADTTASNLTVPDVAAALAGASDIIAEAVADNVTVRTSLLNFYKAKSAIRSVAADAEKDSVYATYYDYRKPADFIPSYAVLALDRGEKEGFVKVTVEVNAGEAVKLMRQKLCGLRNADVLGAVAASATIAPATDANAADADSADIAATVVALRVYLVQTDANPAIQQFLSEAVEDSYERLLHPAMERRIRSELTDLACEGAMKVFAENLRNLLMQPPVKNAVTMGFDPGYRTGCKVAVVDSTGKVLDKTVVFPTLGGEAKVAQAKREIIALIKKHNISVIAIGNGTASHESELFIADICGELKGTNTVAYAVVSEAGASVYSASKLAAEEFPEYDVTTRSAISIARRLQDPLAELVKIDPKAVGVGQYQHDMPAAELSRSLTNVVEDCVNNVGVDLNTASFSLLKFISGITSAVAKNIVAFRDENGRFKNRKDLLKVAKLGKKAYEQAAGFMRIIGGDEPLDNTAVHPESYKLARDYLARKDSGGIPDMTPTLRDIIKELEKPGRDPRDELPAPMLRTDVADINSLTSGMRLKGTVRNVCDFGAFVDIGVHQDGLVHVTKLAKMSNERRRIHPSEVVKIGDILDVEVISVDVPKKRIALGIA